MDYKIVMGRNYKVYELYKDLLNSYVSDYYLEEHWKKLPRSWQDCFGDADVGSLGKLLDFSISIKKLYPLSLLSLRRLITSSTIPRNQVEITSTHFMMDDAFMKLFWKGVKLKKRHEIGILSKICGEAAQKTNCFCIVDIGSGLGHLSRMLSLAYGFRVCTFEADSSLSKAAAELDCAFDQELIRRGIVSRKRYISVHVNKRITPDLSAVDFISSVANAFNAASDITFGIVGLHPCGDLGVTLLRLYAECPNVKFINVASCCYMKLSFEGRYSGFPLSTYCIDNNYKLSYLSCEIACHAIENYVVKLSCAKEYNKLKIHAYRAVLEEILIVFNSNLKHSLVSSVKFNDDITFKRYCEKNLAKYNFKLSDTVISSYEDLIKKTWHKVVTFYSLRLLLAPLIETIILYDRILFLEERDSHVEVLAAFNSKISPRNQVIVATKSECSINER